MESQLNVALWVGVIFILLGTIQFILPTRYIDWMFRQELSPRDAKARQKMHGALNLLLGVIALSFSFGDWKKYTLVLVLVIIVVRNGGVYLINRKAARREV
jgi:hypothetical protein